MHVLLVHDGSAGAEAAVRFLATIGPALEARTTMVVASPALVGRRRTTGTPTDAEEVLRAAGLPTTRTSVEGRTPSSVATSVLDRLDEGDVDLVVTGADDSDVLTRLTGSMVRALLRRSPVPVLVVGHAPVGLHRMLVCTSQQLPHGEEALRPVTTIAAATGAEVELLHVMSQLPQTGDPTDVAGQEHDAAWHRRRATAEGRHLDEVLTVLADEGVEADPSIRHGLVVDEIVAAARELPADLVVLGAHGRPGVVPMLLENITERVVSELARPVLVLRESQDVEGDVPV